MLDFAIRLTSKTFATCVLLVGLLALAACDNRTAEEYVESARALLTSGDPQAAILELKNAVRKDTASVEARALLGQTHLRVSDLPSALKDLERAIDMGATDDETRLALLRTRLALGRYNEVIGELEENQTLTPPYAVMLASAYVAAGDFEKAQPLMQQGLHLAEGLFGMARIAHHESDVPRAIRYLEQAVERDAGLMQAWLYKGELELTVPDPDAALASFNAAARLAGGEVTGTLGVVRAHLLLEDTAAARKKIDSLVARAPDFAPAQYLSGLIAYTDGDAEMAEAALLNVQRVAPDHAPTLYLMGLLQTQKGNLNQARTYLERYLNFDAGNVSARKLLASLHNSEGEPAAVVDLLDPIAQQHSDPQVWAMLGAARLRLGDSAGATAAFQQAVELAPDDAPFRNQLALSLISAGEDEAALAQIDTALNLDDDQFQSDFLVVMLRLRDGDLAGAQEAVANLLVKDPENPLGHNLKGSILLANQDQQGAREAFATALKHDPSYFPASQSLARLAERDGDIDGARAILEEATVNAPENEDAALALIDFAARQNEGAQALTLLESTIARHPDSLRARVGQVRLMLANGDLPRAADAAEALAALAPELPDAHILRAETALATGDASTARAAVNQLQGLADQFRSNKNLLAAAGALHLRTGNLTLARSNLEQAVAFDPAPPMALVSLARLALLEGNAAQASGALEQLAEAGLSNEQTRLLQGDTMLAEGQTDSALAHFKTMAEAGSRAGTSRYGGMLAAQGENAEARRLFSDWLQRFPNDVGIRMLLANLEIQQGNNSDARAQYESMMPTSDPVVLNNLAWIYMEDGDPRAVEMARQAHKALPDNPDIGDTLGWILVSQGEHAEAVSLLRESARAKPADPTIQYHLAVALKESGEINGAREALQRALELGDFPDRESAQTLLKDI